MFDKLKDNARRTINRSSYTLNAATIALLAVAYVGVHTGHMQADIQLNGWQLGGGTTAHQQAEQQLAVLATALPVTSLSAPNIKLTQLPARKPPVR